MRAARTPMQTAFTVTEQAALRDDHLGRRFMLARQPVLSALQNELDALREVVREAKRGPAFFRH